jgi:hypothetical protein
MNLREFSARLAAFDLATTASDALAAQATHITTGARAALDGAEFAVTTTAGSVAASTRSAAAGVAEHGAPGLAPRPVVSRVGAAHAADAAHGVAAAVAEALRRSMESF